MNTFLERIRSSILKPLICETRFPTASKRVCAAKIVSDPFHAATASLQKSIHADSMAYTPKSGSFGVTYCGVVSPDSLTAALNKMEPIVSAAGWWKMEGSYDPNYLELSLEFTRIKA